MHTDKGNIDSVHFIFEINTFYLQLIKVKFTVIIVWLHFHVMG